MMIETELPLGGQVDSLIDFKNQINFDDSVPCKWPMECNQEATWKYIAGCCGFTRLLCDEHQVSHERGMNSTYTDECSHCHTPPKPKYVRI